MDADFWLQRWQQKRIGFHQDQYNTSLTKHWPQLSLCGNTVFVPLCGKSVDMLYLAEQGYEVIGIELSEIAVQEFFAEQQLQPKISNDGDLKLYRHGPFSIYCGDIFCLQDRHLQECNAVYDRASLIALPPAMRDRYADLLAAILPEHCQVLLITLEYDQEKLPGPPFSVIHDEVQRLFSEAWSIDKIGVIEENVRSLQGLECSYRLLKK